jgi:hypothetical protein
MRSLKRSVDHPIIDDSALFQNFCTIEALERLGR